MNFKKTSLAALLAVGALTLSACASTPASVDDAFGTQTPPTTNQELIAEPPALMETMPASVTLLPDAEYTALASLIGQVWASSEESLINLSTTPSGTLTIDQSGTYRLTGVKSDGGVVVDVAGDELVRLILDNASITNPAGSALAILDADGGTAVVVEAGTENSLTDARIYADTSDDAPNAAVYSDDDLVIFGTGSLNVVGNYNDGINAKDGLVIDQAQLMVTSVDDGIRGKDYLAILGGSIDLLAGDDGLKSDNVTDNTAIGQIIIAGGTTAITAGDDAITAEALVHILNGRVTVTQSYEGIEAAQVVIDGGLIDVVASDDGINAASDYTPDRAVIINGGEVTVTAEGDGIDSNGLLLQTGGDVVVHGPMTSANGALDADGGYTVTGGTMFAVGSAGMLISPSSASTQGWVVAPLTSSVAGQTVSIVSNSGDVIATLDALKGAAAVTYAGPGIVNGSNYQVSANGSAVGTAIAGVAAAGGRGPGGRGGQMPAGGDLPGFGDRPGGQMPSGERPGGGRPQR